jgi:hypothetical protein
MLVDATHAVMSAAELAALPEYTTTIPTGTQSGKRWKRNATWEGLDAQMRGHRTNPNGPWMMGEYGEPYDPPADARARPGEKFVPITWRDVLVVD